MRRCSEFNWLELLEGVLLILLGIFSFTRPGSALTGVVILYGFIAMITGIVDIVLYVRIERHTGFGPTISLVSGILSVMAGVMLLCYPDAGIWILILLIPIWFIAHCISRLSHLRLLRLLAGSFSYYFTLIVNIIGIILGCLMICNPWFTLMSVDWIISLYLVLLCIDSVMLACLK